MGPDPLFPRLLGLIAERLFNGVLRKFNHAKMFCVQFSEIHDGSVLHSKFHYEQDSLHDLNPIGDLAAITQLALDYAVSKVQTSRQTFSGIINPLSEMVALIN
jgi:hypothetical protein